MDSFEIDHDCDVFRRKYGRGLTQGMPTLMKYNHNFDAPIEWRLLNDNAILKPRINKTLEHNVHL